MVDGKQIRQDDDFAGMLESSLSFSPPRRGEIRNATILAIKEREIIVDLGAKQDGIGGVFSIHSPEQRKEGGEENGILRLRRRARNRLDSIAVTLGECAPRENIKAIIVIEADAAEPRREIESQKQQE